MSCMQEQMRQMVAKHGYETYKAIPKHKRTMSQQWFIDAFEQEEKKREEFCKLFKGEVSNEPRD